MAARLAYQSWDVTGAVDKVLAIQDQLKDSYKNDVGFPANKLSEVESKFAPSHLFFSDRDLYYSWKAPSEGNEYVFEFLEDDTRAPYRGFYKRTEVGAMYPTLLSANDEPGPGPTEPINTKRGYPVALWQDESCDLKDWHLRNLVDWHTFDLAKRFHNASDYFNITNAIFEAMVDGLFTVNKLVVDTFLATLAGVWSYPVGSELHPFFSGSDDYTADDAYSKNARQFYLKTGEIRKRLDEFRKYVNKYYKAKVAYLTNLNTHEVIGSSLDMEIPAWNQRLADTSDANRTLSYVRDCFLTKDAQNKYKKVGYNLRRNSIDALAETISGVLNKMMQKNRTNWCGHEYGKDNKASEGYALRCRPENLLVFMNDGDLRDCFMVKGSNITGPFTEERIVGGWFKEFSAIGVRFYGLNFLLPSMAIVVDRAAFTLKEYYNEVYDQFHPYDLITSKISHVFKKLVLYKHVACNVIQLAKGQKFAVPVSWGSQNLPYLIESA